MWLVGDTFPIGRDVDGESVAQLSTWTGEQEQLLSSSQEQLLSCSQEQLLSGAQREWCERPCRADWVAVEGICSSIFGAGGFMTPGSHAYTAKSSPPSSRSLPVATLNGQACAGQDPL